jgi:hypothetical protein
MTDKTTKTLTRTLDNIISGTDLGAANLGDTVVFAPCERGHLDEGTCPCCDGMATA